jgi:hypothetical protein
VTINSNRKPKTIAQKNAMVEALSGYIDSQFNEQGFVGDFVTILRPGDSMDRIKSIDTSFAVEQGKKRGRIHAHITMEIIHSTKIRLDPLVLVAGIEEALGYKPYVHIQGTRNAAFNLREYAAKNNLAAPPVVPPNSPAGTPRRRRPVAIKSTLL